MLHKEIWFSLLLFSTLATGNPQPDPYVTHYRAAIAAYQEADSTAFLQHAELALNARPHSTTAHYLKSAALAFAGNADQAIDILQNLANQGLVFKPETQPMFAAIKSTPAFQAVMQQFHQNAQPQGHAKIWATLDEGKYVPEGIAWDDTNQRLFLGSVVQRRIDMVTPNDVTRFLSHQETELYSVFGMHLEADHQRLLVTTSAIAQGKNVSESSLGKTGIIIVDTRNAEVLDQFWLPDQDIPQQLGDLALDQRGNIWTSDSIGGAIYKLERKSGHFNTVIDSGVMRSPQGLVFSADYKTLYIADYRNAILALDVETGKYTTIRPPHTSADGIDGLYRYKNWLIGIQNGVQPNRVLAMRLNAPGSAVIETQILVSSLPEFDDPNLGVVVGDTLLFNANSHWPQFDRENALPDGLSGPIIMQVDLSHLP